MTPIPVAQTPTPTAETVEQQFRRLEAIWTNETGFLSSYTDIVEHPAFQAIIRMREVVVPLMLRDLQQRSQLWVWALPEITGANPVESSDAGDIAKMSEAWLNWGREHSEIS
jgi:hypothetical protein